MSRRTARRLPMHDLITASGLPAAVKEDDALSKHYDMARVALAKHDLVSARPEAAAYAFGSQAKKNDVRLRQANELNALVSLEAKQYDATIHDLSFADQENPAVWYMMSRAYALKGDVTKARELSDKAARMNILPTLPYVFTRAALASATASATSENARGTSR